MATDPFANFDPDTNDNGRNFLIAIAVDQHGNGQNQKDVVGDVQAVVRELQNRYGFKKNHIIELYEEEATYENVIQGFGKLSHVPNRSINDKFIFYYSGISYPEGGIWIKQVHGGSVTTKKVSFEEIYHLFGTPDNCYFLIDAGVDPSNIQQLVSKKASSGSRRGSFFLLAAYRVTNPPITGENQTQFTKGILKVLKNNREIELPLEFLASYLRKYLLSKSEDGFYPNTVWFYWSSPILNPAHPRISFNLSKSRLQHGNEDKDWKRAISIGTKTSLLNFLHQHPESKYSNTAKVHIESLEDIEAWQEALNINSTENYLQYIKDYPKGRFKKEAEKRVNHVVEDELWRVVISRNTVYSFNKYIKKYPNGRYVSEAKNAIRRLRTEYISIEQRQREKTFLISNNVDSDWVNAKKIDSTERYKKHYEDFPESPYIKEAKARYKQKEKERFSHLRLAVTHPLRIGKGNSSKFLAALYLLQDELKTLERMKQKTDTKPTEHAQIREETDIEKDYSDAYTIIFSSTQIGFEPKKSTRPFTPGGKNIYSYTGSPLPDSKASKDHTVKVSVFPKDSDLELHTLEFSIQVVDYAIKAIRLPRSTMFFLFGLAGVVSSLVTFGLGVLTDVDSLVSTASGGTLGVLGLVSFYQFTAFNKTTTLSP